MIGTIAKLAFKQMFGQPASLPEGPRFKQTYTMSNLTKITTELPYVSGTIRMTFLEQNPHKGSVYGQRARNGAQIMWVIASFNNKEKWLGRIENGRWYPK